MQQDHSNSDAHQSAQAPTIIQQNQPAADLGMSPYMRAFTQFGFAGLAALMLVMMYRDMSRDNRDMKEMYRDESERNRIEFRMMSDAADKRNDSADKRNNEIANRLTTLTFELTRATDALRAAGLKLEQSVTAVKPPNDEQGFVAPRPRLKSGGVGPTEPGGIP
jgi:hypothetical protein